MYCGWSFYVSTLSMFAAQEKKIKNLKATSSWHYHETRVDVFSSKHISRKRLERSDFKTVDKDLSSKFTHRTIERKK